MSTYIKDIQFDLIVTDSKDISHKQALLTLAQNAADFLNISEKMLHQKLHEKETIATSAIGDGVAIPHLKIRGINNAFTMLLTTNKTIETETPDNNPVELYCLLLSPMEDGPIHLRRLSRLSRLLKNETLRKRINETKDRDVIQSLLMDPDGWLMAA